MNGLGTRLDQVQINTVALFFVLVAVAIATGYLPCWGTGSYITPRMLSHVVCH